MNKRPISITIVAWYLVGMSIFSLLTIWCANTDPVTQQIMALNLLSIPAQQFALFVGFAATLVAGTALLLDYQWGRVLFVGWSASSLLLGVVISPTKLLVVPGLLVVALISYFLFSDKANAFFSRSS